MTKHKAVFFVFVFLYAIIIVKLFMLQVFGSSHISGDYVNTKKIYPSRGKILDVHGKPFAVNAASYQLFAEPQKIKNKDYVIMKLAEVLSEEKASIEARFDDTKSWISIKRNLPKETKDTISLLKINGIGFQEETQRYYPEASLSAHLLGFVGKTAAGENTGYFGIEGFYEKDLAGLSGLMKSERDLENQPIFFGTQERIDPEDGRDLILSIDRSVQQIIKERLKSGMERFEAKEGCIIVADPYTMEIIGLSCLPDFDPDMYYDFSENYFKNTAISDVYEPGSTFKPLIVAAGIEEKAIKPNELFNEEGPVTVSDYQIQTWNSKYEGKITITRILEKSSNVGMVYIGSKLGDKKLYDYIRDYGFGTVTGIDLQGEVTGYLRPRSEWYPIDYATATFGQGIAVTPMQMIRAFSSIINGGSLLKPYVVKQVVSATNKREMTTKIQRKMISPHTSEIVRAMLKSTVENGDSKWAKPKGYAIGGKTGTAQIPIKGHYDATKTIASFIGFVPVNKPRFIALVIIREPKSSQWGSETAAPLFFEIAKDLIIYYNIAPE